MDDENIPKYLRNVADSYGTCQKTIEKDLKLFQEGKEKKGPRIKTRYLALLMVISGEFFLLYHRLTMSVSLPAMVNSSVVVNEIEYSKSCLNLVDSLDNMNHTEADFEEDGEFPWSTELQGFILGSSFLSYTIAMPILAKLAEMYGGKNMLFYCILFSSVFSFFSPFAAKWNVYALITVQILRGISQGGVIPAEALLIVNWFPKQERGLAYTISLCGSPVGAVVGSYLTGIICKSTFLGGWQSAFFSSGCMGLISAIFIYFFLYDNPRAHPNIFPGELEYIISNQESVLTEKRPKAPWKSLFSSVPVYALSYAYFGIAWANSYFISVHPTFLKTILHYPIDQDGLFNALPFLVQIFTIQITGILSTALQRKNCISIDKSRKFWNFLSTLGYSLCVLGVYFAGCNRSLSIFFFIAAFAFIGLSFSGCYIACADMSPTFTASIEAISCTLGTLSYFILPVVVGYLTNGLQTIEQWNKIFFINIAVVLSSGVIFAVFGSAKVQPWNDVPEKSSEEMEEFPKK